MSKASKVNYIKKGIREVLLQKEIFINRIQFTSIDIKENTTSIGKIILSLDSIDGIAIDTLKNQVDDYLIEVNCEYNGLLLDI